MTAHVATRLPRALAGAVSLAALAALGTLTSCAPAEGSANANRVARSVMVVGIDVSGSFEVGGRYDNAIEFAANYIYGHLHGLGGLKVPSAVFVGSIGGQNPDEAKSFQPIHTFQKMSVEEIAAFLRREYPAHDGLTDFNPFFERVAVLVKRQGLVLAPLNIVIFSDGVPDLASGVRATNHETLYSKIDVSSLEYLSRNITVRLLYPTPPVSVLWEKRVPRHRVRMWTVDNEVMQTWKKQLKPGAPAEAQKDLWKWINDNVDFRVRSVGML